MHAGSRGAGTGGVGVLDMAGVPEVAPGQEQDSSAGRTPSPKLPLSLDTVARGIEEIRGLDLRIVSIDDLKRRLSVLPHGLGHAVPRSIRTSVCTARSDSAPTLNRRMFRDCLTRPQTVSRGIKGPIGRGQAFSTVARFPKVLSMRLGRSQATSRFYRNGDSVGRRM